MFFVRSGSVYAVLALLMAVFASTDPRSDVRAQSSGASAPARSSGKTTGTEQPNGTSVQHVVDFNGDGRTDISVARGLGANIVWYTWDGVQPLPNGFTAVNFGLAAVDFIVPEDFDGDNRTDVAVWRPGAAGSAFFYILQSTDGTLRAENFGQTGDDPAVVGDYDGDGRADPAVFRCPPFGGSPGQCYFFYRGSLNNPNGNITFAPLGFGVDGDFFPYVGDFDGDLKNDFCVQHADPTSPANGQFVMIKSMDGQAEFINWGLSTDFIIPGDYDGDGKTDICVSRNNFPTTGAKTFFTLTRTGQPIFTQWGLNGDTPVPGDYDDDGATDVAVWRGSATPGATAFYALLSSNSSLLAVPFGQCPSVSNCDYPVANWPVH